MQGDVVRVTCIFTFNVPNQNVFFELTNQGTGITTVVPIGQTVAGMTITIDGQNPMKCSVDVDTYARVGNWSYYFYSRDTNKAGAKGAFSVA